MQNNYESHPRIRPIPQQRVIEKMDAYMSRRDYAGAERHLLYWLEEARAGVLQSAPFHPAEGMV